jgi:RNA polymerase sigma-70 factor (family 1)
MSQDINSEQRWVIQVAKDNDEKAFRKLFELHYAPLVQYSTYIIGSFSLAEEIVSEVFVNLWKNRLKLAEVQDFKKYIYTSTKNKTIDYIRQAKNLSFISLDKNELKEYITYSNPEETYIEEEVRLKLEAAILKLPEKCRMIYRLVKEEQMKYREVAELLDISPKTVENQMIIAMKRIREEISLYYNTSAKQSHQKSMFFLSFFLMF